MPDSLTSGSQLAYTEALEKAGAAAWGHRRCEEYLIGLGATPEQAKNGAYNYLHHYEHLVATKSGTREKYDQHLDDFRAATKRPIECIRFLEHLGYSAGQAKSAVHSYRSRRGLIRT